MVCGFILVIFVDELVDEEMKRGKCNNVINNCLLINLVIEIN